MAAGLEMNVTAEGVETADQMNRLKAMACECGQGFFFREPLSGRDTHRMLKDGVWTIAGVAG
jgi:EAL domain-containing protein (putative c-di-GMP-specific phosphodiesterase class I)